jgi:hypothetical protein
MQHAQSSVSLSILLLQSGPRSAMSTSKVLPEHTTESEAHAACRRYEAALWRRTSARPLTYLAYRAITYVWLA